MIILVAVQNNLEGCVKIHPVTVACLLLDLNLFGWNKLCCLNFVFFSRVV